jgi:cellulose biosynthesis protein BcsQ
MIITVTNGKGGVGKTTLSLCMVQYMARVVGIDGGVLWIDYDGQMNSTDRFLLMAGATRKDIPAGTSSQNFFDPKAKVTDLVVKDRTVRFRPTAMGESGRVYLSPAVFGQSRIQKIGSIEEGLRLLNKLKTLPFHSTVIDTDHTLDMGSAQNALIAADVVVIPAGEMKSDENRGVVNTLDTLKDATKIRARVGLPPARTYVVPNKVDTRTPAKTRGRLRELIELVGGYDATITPIIAKLEGISDVLGAGGDLFYEAELPAAKRDYTDVSARQVMAIGKLIVEGHNG